MSDTIEDMINRLTERQRHEFSLACARRVQRLMRDPRSIAALDTRERWLRGSASEEEMTAAWAAARAAAWDAARAASDAAWAASAASWDASAASDAARAAAWDAAAASWDASAASDAAWAAARAASDSAWAAAYASERAWQRAELERMLGEGGGA